MPIGKGENMPINTDEGLKALLAQSKTVAVVGWSNKTDRPSYQIAAALKQFGYEIYPVNPTVASTPEQPVYASLADIPVKIDVVDIFRRPEDVPGVVAEAIAIGAKAIWMQMGIVNEAAAAQAEAAGLSAVMDRCMKVEHRRLRGQ
jgi:uncharacterized protein